MDQFKWNELFFYYWMANIELYCPFHVGLFLDFRSLYNKWNQQETWNEPIWLFPVSFLSEEEEVCHFWLGSFRSKFGEIGNFCQGISRRLKWSWSLAQPEFFNGMFIALCFSNDLSWVEQISTSILAAFHYIIIKN